MHESGGRLAAESPSSWAGRAGRRLPEEATLNPRRRSGRRRLLRRAGWGCGVVGEGTGRGEVRDARDPGLFPRVEARVDCWAVATRVRGSLVGA